MFKQLLAIVFIGLLAFSQTSCTEGLNELQETIYSAEDHSNSESEFFSTLEIVDDLASTDGKLNKAGGTILPSGAVIKYTDSLWTDGDGLDFSIDFGPLGTSEPKGLLCQDGRYRAGKLNLSLTQRYSTIGAELNVEIRSEDAYYTGNGRDMYQLEGVLSIVRSTENSIDLTTTDAKLSDDEKTLTWSSQSTITIISDAGAGIWRDVYEITGSSNGVNRNGESYTVTIDEPLKKKVELGCAKTFVSGLMTLSIDSSNKVIRVNYDPYDDEACDNIAEAEINGKKTIFRVR
jgi:hypothetical protein